MYDYTIVLRGDHERLARSDGSVRDFKAGTLMPFFKGVKIKLVKTEFDGEFDIQFRNRVEQLLVESNLAFWDDLEAHFRNLSDEERTQFSELLMAVPSYKREEPTAEEQVEMDAHAAYVREIISKPGFRFKTITNDPSDGDGPSSP
jgi:hypothetical protein